MGEIGTNIERDGWSPVSFDMPERDREAFTRLGRDVILRAVEFPELKAALNHELDPTLTVGSNNPTFFGVSEARNSQDKKLWIHSGFQTRQHLEDHHNGVIETYELSEYLEALDEVLQHLKTGFSDTLAEFGTRKQLDEMFFPADWMKRILHVRIVRYLDLDKQEVGDEVIAGHGDMSFATIQFYETHAEYLHAAKVAVEMVRWDKLPDRQNYFAQLYSKMSPVEYDTDSEAAFFFGFASAGVSHARLGSGFKDYPNACYHAGFLPEADTNRTSSDWMLPHERLAAIGFLHPRLEILQNPTVYRLPIVATCRPLK